MKKQCTGIKFQERGHVQNCSIDRRIHLLCHTIKIQERVDDANLKLLKEKDGEGHCFYMDLKKTNEDLRGGSCD